jgi:hypothetical protein
MSAGMVSRQMINPGATRCLSIILNDVRAQRKLILGISLSVPAIGARMVLDRPRCAAAQKARKVASLHKTRQQPSLAIYAG